MFKNMSGNLMFWAMEVESFRHILINLFMYHYIFTLNNNAFCCSMPTLLTLHFPDKGERCKESRIIIHELRHTVYLKISKDIYATGDIFFST